MEAYEKPIAWNSDLVLLFALSISRFEAKFRYEMPCLLKNPTKMPVGD
jgi:hypothetical protein